MELLEHLFAVQVNQGRKRNDPDAYKPRRRRNFMPTYYAGETPKPKQEKIGKQLDDFAKKFQEAMKR